MRYVAVLKNTVSLSLDSCGGDFTKYVGTLTKYFGKLETLGSKYSDQEKVGFLLLGLPEAEFDSVTTVIENLNIIKYQDVVTRISAYLRRKQGNDGSLLGSIGDDRKNNDSNDNNGGRSVFRGICFWCGKPGHSKKYCRARQAGKPKTYTGGRKSGEKLANIQNSGSGLNLGAITPFFNICNSIFLPRGCYFPHPHWVAVSQRSNPALPTPGAVRHYQH